MLPFRKILFPVDYSEPCRAVVTYVKEIAHRFSAEVTLVHAYPPILLPYGDLAVDPVLPEDILGYELARMKAFALEMFPGQHVETITESGEAGTVVHRVVQHQGTDLVMLGTHGYGPIRRFLLGSLTAKVLHDVSAAVWTAAGPAVAGRPPVTHYKSVLCALDESDEAEAVLRAGAALARAYGAQLWIVHVLEAPRSTLKFDFNPYRQELIDDAEFKLRELKARLGIEAPQAVIETGVATIAEGIHHEAIRRNADLIVMGRGGAQGTFTRMWSRLYPVIRESPCPVISI
jgi:nucleotide-binding universal stress UspA family protein